MTIARTIARRAWHAACLASLLAFAGVCVLWARSDGTHRDRIGVAFPGWFVALAWFPDGLQGRAAGHWPGRPDVWVGPSPATSLAFSVESLRPWKPLGLNLDGLVGKVRVALGPDGRPVAATPRAAATVWVTATPSEPLPYGQVSDISHWWAAAAAAFAAPPACWLARRLWVSRRRARRPADDSAAPGPRPPDAASVPPAGPPEGK